MSPPLLEIAGLSVEFLTGPGPLRVVDDVSFAIAEGATVGLVGESGSGKSVTALSVLRLHDDRVAALRGSIRFRGEDLFAASAARMRELRGSKIAMVFQDPMASLNPAHRVGAQVAESIRLHEGVTRKEAEKRVAALLRDVGIADPADRARAYPHQLSGGMRQRVMIAMAIACNPDLLIADEPTTALDVTTQAQILDVLRRLQRERKMGLLLITHDLGLVAEMCEQVVVLYAGRVVERGPTDALLRTPLHPYTAGLVASTPTSGTTVSRLREIRGMVPDLRHLPPGCRFRERCDFAQTICAAAEPPLISFDAGREHRCLFPLDATATRA